VKIEFFQIFFPKLFENFYLFNVSRNLKTVDEQPNFRIDNRGYPHRKIQSKQKDCTKLLSGFISIDSMLLLAITVEHLGQPAITVQN